MQEPLVRSLFCLLRKTIRKYYVNVVERFPFYLKEKLIYAKVENLLCKVNLSNWEYGVSLLGRIASFFNIECCKIFNNQDYTEVEAKSDLLFQCL